MLQAIETEIDRNFDFFQRNLSKYLPTDLGRFALLRDCTVIQFCGTSFEAEMAGETQFPDGIYSIQEVTDSPVDLGFFTYAFDQGPTG